MDSPLILYSATSDGILSPDRIPLREQLKAFVLSEISLIATNIKPFVAWAGLSGALIAQTASDGDSPIKEWTLAGALIVAIGWLVRSLSQKDKKLDEKDKKIEELYNRLVQEAEDDQKESHPSRHKK